MEARDILDGIADQLLANASIYAMRANEDGIKSMGTAFLNGYQTALTHVGDFMDLAEGNMDVLLKSFLKDMSAAFKVLADRAGVKESTFNVVEEQPAKQKCECGGESCVHYALHLDSEGHFCGGCMWDKGVGFCGNYEPREIEFYNNEYDD